MLLRSLDVVAYVVPSMVEAGSGDRVRLTADEDRQFDAMRSGVAAQRRAALSDPPEMSAAEADAAWEAELDRPDEEPAEAARAVAAPVRAGPLEAAVWRRLVAVLVDAACSAALVAVAAGVSELLWLRSQGAVSVPLPALAALFVLAGWAHTLAGEAFAGGATLGKRAAGLRVVDAGGGRPSAGRVVLRRFCLDVLMVVLVALALWFTMVRQHGGLVDGAVVAFALSDFRVFAAFLVNLVVVLLFARHLDPQGRFPHDRLAGLYVLGGEGRWEMDRAGSAEVGRPAGRRVAAPVGAGRVSWDAESMSVLVPRPWDGRRWRPDLQAAAEAASRRRKSAGRVERFLHRLELWVEGGRPPAASSRELAAPAPSCSSSRLARALDALVSWSDQSGRTRDGHDA